MTPLEAAIVHMRRAEEKYKEYRQAQEVVAAYEEEVLAACNGNKSAASEKLSKDWKYKPKAGARSGIEAQMRVEIEMARMYAAIAAAAKLTNAATVRTNLP